MENQFKVDGKNYQIIGEDRVNIAGYGVYRVRKTLLEFIGFTYKEDGSFRVYGTSKQFKRLREAVRDIARNPRRGH